MVGAEGSVRCVFLFVTWFAAPVRAANDACDGAGALQHGGSLGTADAIVDGAGQAIRLGAAVATGDFDGDGAEDLALGAPDDDAAGADAGSVLLFYGPIRRTNLDYRAADARTASPCAPSPARLWARASPPATSPATDARTCSSARRAPVAAVRPA